MWVASSEQGFAWQAVQDNAAVSTPSAAGTQATVGVLSQMARYADPVACVRESLLAVHRGHAQQVSDHGRIFALSTTHGVSVPRETVF